MTSTDAASARHYSAAILLPAAVDEPLRHWSLAQEGGTWPSWGGHITVLAGFTTLTDLDRMQQAMGRSGAGFQPFTLRLNRAVRDSYWGRPGLETVMLTPDPESSGAAALRALRELLNASLASLVRDLCPDLNGKPYLPHVTLTTGLRPREAAKLAEAAAQLDCEFIANELWLLEEILASAGPDQMRPLRAFALGQ